MHIIFTRVAVFNLLCTLRLQAPATQDSFDRLRADWTALRGSVQAYIEGLQSRGSFDEDAIAKVVVVQGRAAMLEKVWELPRPLCTTAQRVSVSRFPT